MNKPLIPQSLIVTGGAGFIGSNFVRLAFQRGASQVVVVDKLTYAGNLRNLADVETKKGFVFVKADIKDQPAMSEVLKKYQPSCVVNFAAETHVDRSIDGPRTFIETNLLGTFELLEAVRKHWTGLSSGKEGFRLLHVSTDEVYGTLGPKGLFSESTPYSPNSPYAASKAGADHLVQSYHETYGIPTIITNCSNNYGPYQFPEKLIPLVILNALEGKPLPVYGDGGNVRDWIYVEDHCDGVWQALTKGSVGDHYNIGASQERINLDVVNTICSLLEGLYPVQENPALAKAGVSNYGSLISFVTDRPGHDRRYAIDATKIRQELGWAPQHTFDQGMRKTIQWYLDNRAWCEEVQSGNYRRERLGLSK